MRYYVIGDIHGRYKKLLKIWDIISTKPKGKLIFLGDYVDRGRNSREVVSFIEQLVKEDKAIAILGNHDDMFIQWWYNKRQLWEWKENYLKPTLNSYRDKHGVNKYKIQEHINFLKTLPKSYITETFYFCHSGDPKDPLWGRPFDNDTDLYDGKYCIHGHTSLEKPFFGKHRANIDTGAGWSKGGSLTCGVWEEGNTKPLEVINVK